MSDTTGVTRPTMSQHLAAIREATRQERLQILALVSSYPQTNPDVARVLNALRADILGRNR